MDKSESTRAITFIVSLVVNTEGGVEQNKREAFRKWGRGDGKGGEKRNFRNSYFRYKKES
jgi:hypothetical protein